MQSSLKLFSLVTMILGSTQVFAAQVQMSSGDVVTIQANTATQVSCEGAASESTTVVAKSCHCGSSIVNGRFQVLMRLIYATGSYKEVLLQEIHSSEGREKCERAAEMSCR